MAVKTYFITGATGTVGSAIVPLLLCDSKVQLILLIRARDQQHLTERMEKLCRFWEVNYQDIRNRVKAISGDMSLDRFGLENNIYDSLANKCTHIIHCGGVVRMNLPLEDARKAALDSTRNIVSLAETCQENKILQKIEFVSTVGVAGRLSGLVPEEWITKPRLFHNTYEQAKAEAETIIKEKVAEGLPITVLRPSMVVGDSVTGKISAFKVFYHLCEFLSGGRTKGVVPRLPGIQLDTIPVDYVAEVIVKSSTLDNWTGKILHLCSGSDYAIEILSLEQLVRHKFIQHRERVPRRIKVPLSLFKKLIPLFRPLMPSMTRRSLGALPFFLVYLEEKQTFVNFETLKLVESEGILLPKPESYLARVLDYYLENSLPTNI